MARVFRALAEMGPQARPVVPALLELAKGEHEGVRWWARQALKKIDPTAARKAGLP
jgi:hypothetical protein